MEIGGEVKRSTDMGRIKGLKPNQIFQFMAECFNRLSAHLITLHIGSKITLKRRMTDILSNVMKTSRVRSESEKDWT